MEEIKELLDFIDCSPTCFHAVFEIKKKLVNEGFIELFEDKDYLLEKNKNYFVIRNDSSIIAFKIGNKLDQYSFNIVASHTDSPMFKLKPSTDLYQNNYRKLNVESYGGMICYSFLDRPLSVAGRVVIEKNQEIKTELININEPSMIIPSLPIHFNRGVNSNFQVNVQVDMLPFYSQKNESFIDYLRKASDLGEGRILGSDLYLYNKTNGYTWGEDKEFFSSPRIDNLESSYATLRGFIDGSNEKSINVYCSFDSEEVGSNSRQGAFSTFLKDTLKRINKALGFNDEKYYQALDRSFIISCDNAHALNPNHAEKYDLTNTCYMNNGIVIKSNANQKYITDGLSSSIFKEYLDKEQIPYQNFANRSDEKGGSTLGAILTNQVSILGIDIGLAQLAMHSALETAGTKDYSYLRRAITLFYNKHFTKNKDIYRIEE